eukprot:49325-Chlamydomonas_euryale.AAC.2
MQLDGNRLIARPGHLGHICQEEMSGGGRSHLNGEKWKLEYSPLAPAHGANVAWMATGSLQV